MLKRTLIIGASLLLAAHIATAGYLDDIGLTELRARDASLDGSGVTVAQVEASTTAGDWQTDPANMGLSSGIFAYFYTDSDDTDEINTEYPDGAEFSLSLESSHANNVGLNFFGATTGVAPKVEAIQIFSAGYFFYDGKTNDLGTVVTSTSIIYNSTSTGAKIINQSYVYTDGAPDYTPTEYSSNDELFDDYAATHDVLFINGVGNTTGAPPSPATMYNGIAVGLISGSSSIGPTDNGRIKPDIAAPSNLTSYATPYVAGCATLLVQAGNRGDAGTVTSSTDIRTLKALLLNGATKTTGWTQIDDEPLDRNHGAGALNINRSHLQLAAGQYSEIENNTVTDSGADHLPPSNSSNTASNTGWNLSTLTNTSTRSGFTRTYYDSTDHYYFNCDATEASTFNLNATLVWNRNENRSAINNLDLFLYQEDGTLVASSISSVDNVEHLYELDLAPGRYVLSVYKPESGRDSTSETYALAFNFEAGAPVAADSASAVTQSSSTILLGWNDNAGNETGYRIERSTSGGTYSTLTTLEADTQSYLDASCDAGTTYDYQIIAYNDDGDATAAEASATSYTIQEDWRLLYFSTTADTGDAADDADPELDGLINILEFATGSDPETASSPPIDISELVDNRQFSFTWRNNSTLNFSLCYSEDLSTGFNYYSSSSIDGDWGSKLEFIHSVPIDSELDTLTYGIKDTVSSDKVFIRLQINAP